MCVSMCVCCKIEPAIRQMQYLPTIMQEGPLIQHYIYNLARVSNLDKHCRSWKTLTALLKQLSE